MSGFTLDDIGRSLSWGALGAFLRRLDLTSETARELEPDLSVWAGTLKTNIILADIYDMLAMLNANLCAIGTGKRAQKPKGYSRPGDRNNQKIGSKNALPPDQLEAWFEKKRKEYKSKNSRR